jgi:uncharacterized membrane protein YdjX (TVP38/TMEM64 family)
LIQLKNLSIARKLSLILALAGFILITGHELELYLPALELRIETLGAFAPLGFIAIFIVLTPFFVSVDTLCFGAGLLFSFGSGEFYVVISTYLASALIFFLGRYLIKDRVIAFISNHKHLAALDSAINNQPFKLMFLLRLTPLPFAMLSYALSVTQVKFWPYLAATSGILIYNSSLVYMGYTTKHLAGLISGSDKQSGVSYPLLVLGAVISLLVLFYVTKIAGETINRLSSEKSGPAC